MKVLPKHVNRTLLLYGIIFLFNILIESLNGEFYEDQFYQTTLANKITKKRGATRKSNNRKNNAKNNNNNNNKVTNNNKQDNERQYPVNFGWREVAPLQSAIDQNNYWIPPGNNDHPIQLQTEIINQNNQWFAATKPVIVNPVPVDINNNNNNNWWNNNDFNYNYNSWWNNQNTNQNENDNPNNWLNAQNNNNNNNDNWLNNQNYQNNNNNQNNWVPVEETTLKTTTTTTTTTQKQFVPTPPPYVPVPPQNPSSGSIYDKAIDDNCMKCLCFIESWCSDVGCVMDQGSLSCGWYQLKYEYWLDCGQPGGDWKTCSNSKKCAEGCVKQYMNRYGQFCTEPGTEPRCQDLARIHNGGPYGCKSNNTEYYGWLIGRCLKREAPYENIDTYKIPT